MVDGTLKNKTKIFLRNLKIEFFWIEHNFKRRSKVGHPTRHLPQSLQPLKIGLWPLKFK